MLTYNSKILIHISILDKINEKLIILKTFLICGITKTDQHEKIRSSADYAIAVRSRSVCTDEDRYGSGDRW